MYRGILVALLLLLVVGGCVGTPLGGISDEGAKTVVQAKTVGVISAVGGKFALQKVGITVFGNELNEVPIGPWGLDEAVASQVSAVLSKRFTVKRIAVPQGAFAAYEKPEPFGDSNATLKGIVRQLAGSANCDLYIVVTNATTSFGSGTNQVVAGIGMVESGGAINPDNVTLYAVTTVHLYDGRTFERLLWQRPGFSIGSSFGNVVNGPHRRLDRTWWPATPQAVQSDKYKAAARSLLTESVGATIPEMVGLTAKKGGA
jgi:hypothetical protein